ncbi:MAG TPA: SIMPL domain-containing protein [Allosphingosinicella sp.]|jgi:hypothetical protein
MRILFAAALLAASSVFAVVPSVAADSPVSVPQLAPGEVLLEVSGLAIVRTPATSAVVRGTLFGRGGSEEEARRNLAAEVQRISTAARAAGAGPADIVVRPVIVSEGITPQDVYQTPPADGAADAEPREFHAVQSSVVIRLRNAGAARELHSRIAGSDPIHSYGSPVYELADDSAPRREARRQAIASSRADAETYADAVGMRIVRMVRITERAGLDFAGLAVSESAAGSELGSTWGRANDEAMVDTVAVVGVDYVLAPR